MSALAMIFKKKGYSVSGSDKIINQSILDLKSHGIKVFKEQKKENIKEITKLEKEKLVIILSSAIKKDNEELQTATQYQLKILHRSDLLHFLINTEKQSILIAGSHGKTTTSTLITTLLASNQKDPTAIIGGIIPYYNSNSHAGKGELLVAEIDESDGSIIKYTGTIGVITNLELDHTDYYKSIDYLIEAIQIFSENCSSIIANHDCNKLREYLPNKVHWWSSKQYENSEFSGIPIYMDGKNTMKISPLFQELASIQRML